MSHYRILLFFVTMLGLASSFEGVKAADEQFPKTTKKQDALSIAYGDDFYTAGSSAENREIARAVRSMQRCKKPPLIIENVVQEIKEKYRIRGLRKTNTRQIKSGLNALRYKTDLGSYIEYRLLKTLDFRDLSREAVLKKAKLLKKLPQTIQNNLSRLVPLYLELSDCLLKLSEHFSERSEFNDQTSQLLERVKSISKLIQYQERNISVDVRLDIRAVGARETNNSADLDRTSLLRQKSETLRSLRSQYKRFKQEHTQQKKRKAQVLEHDYAELKARVHRELNDSNVTALRKAVLHQGLKRLRKTTRSSGLLADFENQVTKHLCLSSYQYQRVENAISAFQTLPHTSKGHINWELLSHTDFSDLAIPSKITQLTKDLNTAIETRLNWEEEERDTADLDNSASLYSGNFKHTERIARDILNSYFRTQKTQSIVTFAKAFPQQLGSLLKGTAFLLGGVPYMLIQEIGCITWQTGQASASLILNGVNHVITGIEYRKQKEQRKKALLAPYATAYPLLKERVERELSGDISPLRKLILNRLFKALPKKDCTTRQLEEFDRNFEKFLNHAYASYQQLENTLAELKRLEVNSELTSTNHSSSDTELSAHLIETLIENLKRARESQYCPEWVILFSGNTQIYHGNYKDTETEATTVLKTYYKKHRARLSTGFFKTTQNRFKELLFRKIDSPTHHSARIAIAEAKAEIKAIKSLSNHTLSEWVYVQRLKRNIEKLHFRIIHDEEILPHHLDLFAISNQEADLEYERILDNRKRGFRDRSEEFWSLENSSRTSAKTEQSLLDMKINKLLTLYSKDFYSKVLEFREKHPSCLNTNLVTYSVLAGETKLLSSGKWPDSREVTALAETTRKLEALEAYDQFLRHRKTNRTLEILPFGSTLASHEGKCSSEKEEDHDWDHFLTNFTSLPEQLSGDTDESPTCLICFETVTYDFKTFSDYIDVPIQYDKVVQVPGDENAHKLSTCGHLIHRFCLEGLHINRGLATYKCPKCQTFIPYYELDDQRYQLKYGFSWTFKAQ